MIVNSARQSAVITEANHHKPSETSSVLHNLPKVELHRHLEGSLRIETLLSIALEYDITLPSVTAETLRPYVQLMPDEPRSMQQFLSKFAILRQFYRSEAIIKRVTREVIADAAADNIRYMELRFTPKALNNIVNRDYKEVINWVCEAAREAASANNIKVGLIVAMNRHESLDIALNAFEAALALREQGIVGVDLAGQEANYPVSLFRSLFERAQAEGLGITIHAGEWAGPESVRSAVEVGATRIGHGIRTIEDPELVQLLVERGIVLEVCPSSNVDSGAVLSLKDHPLEKLYTAGVRTTLNTDDPLISGITLSDEFARVMAQTALTLNDLKRMQILGARAAFLPSSERTALAVQFENWFFPPATQPLKPHDFAQT